MKKFFNIFVAVALAVAASTSLAACGDDDPDDPDVPDTPTTKTVKEADITTLFYVNQGIMDAYDIQAKSFLGQELTFTEAPVSVNYDGEDLQMYAMQFDGASNAIPFISRINITFTLKDGYKLPEKSDFMLIALAEGTISYTDGTNNTYAASGYKMHNTGVLSDRIDDYTAALNKHFGRITATLNSTGLVLDCGTEE